MYLKCIGSGSHALSLTANLSYCGNDDYKVLKFKHFQDPLVSSSKTFEAI